MSQKILQINFKFSVPAADLSQGFAPFAQPIAETPGLNWKIWLMNEAESESGGIYLFDDQASLDAYLAGPIVGGLKTHPALSNMSVKVFGVSEEPSRVTRAPIRETVGA